MSPQGHLRLGSPETINKRIRDIRQLLDQAGYAIQPGQHKLASLDDLHRLAIEAGRQRVTALMTTDPNRTWSGQELAAQLQITPHNLLTQLAEWSRLGLLAHTDYGTYALNTRPGNTSWTNAPDP